jgi:2-methylcitrate dehydratase PrpD
MPDETRQLAEFVRSVGVSPLPADVIDYLCWYQLDNLACGFLGSRQPWFRTIVRALAPRGGAPLSHTFGHAEPVDVSSAALVNGAAISAFEIEHAYGGAHPGAVVLSAVLALGESLHASGEIVLRALAAGYEVNLRVGSSHGRGAEAERGFHNPALSGVFGAAAGCSVLLGLTPDQIVSAFGIAASHACGLIAFVWSGAETKRLHLGRSAQLGLESALLAAEGFMGPPEAIEGRYGYLAAYTPTPKPERLCSGLGTDWRLFNVSVKAHPAHGAVQPFIAPLDTLRAEGVRAADIISLTVVGSPDAGEDRHLDRVPATVLGAQYSVPFLAARVLAHGAESLLTLDDAGLRDETVRQLAERVQVVTRPGETGRTINDGGEVTVELPSGTITREAPGLVGLDRDRLAELCMRKFTSYTAFALDHAARERARAVVATLGDLGDVIELGEVLARATRPLRGLGAQAGADFANQDLGLFQGREMAALAGLAVVGT